ncbi:MAG: hypothetical protein LUE12_02000 [Ruminococcus sp.]|nr:hypothetical protein [Ruminococcus sp.]
MALQTAVSDASDGTHSKTSHIYLSHNSLLFLQGDNEFSLYKLLIRTIFMILFTLGYYGAVNSSTILQNIVSGVTLSALSTIIAVIFNYEIISLWLTVIFLGTAVASIKEQQDSTCENKNFQNYDYSYQHGQQKKVINQQTMPKRPPADEGDIIDV